MTEKFRVGITRDALRADGSTVFDPVALEVLNQAGNVEWEFLPDTVRELTAEHAARYDALCVLGPKVTAATLSRPDRRLCIVARHGVGYDNVDVAACNANGVLLTITPDGVRRPVATIILTFILALASKLFIKHELTRSGRWAERTNHMGEGLTGKTVGSIGVGNIGKEAFKVLMPLDMKHIGNDLVVTQDQVNDVRVTMKDFDSVIRESDFLCINVPLSDKTRHLIGEREFGMMKKTAYLINTARGPIVDEQALYRALSDKRIAGAAIDVFDQEPTPDDNPLFKLDNIITTPHALCWTDECFRMLAEGAFTSAVQVARGETPKFVVNREALAHPDLQARLARNSPHR